VRGSEIIKFSVDSEHLDLGEQRTASWLLKQGRVYSFLAGFKGGGFGDVGCLSAAVLWK